MTIQEPQNSETQSKGSVIFALVLLGTGGVLMLLQGLGLLTNNWLHPSPDVPQWVFLTIGLILLMAAVLAAGHLIRIPQTLTNTMGFGSIAIAIIMMNWLVFFAKDASCSIENGGLAITTGALMCRGLAGDAALLFDLLFAALGLQYLWQRLSR